MTRRHTQSMTAGAATLLASVPMSTIFDSFTWFFYAALAIAAVEGVAMLARTLRAPVWTQVIAMLGGLLLMLTFLFPSGHEWLRFVPSGGTFVHFNDLLVASGEQVSSSTPPVPDLDGLLLLTTVGIGLVAMLVDLAAVGLRRPALAGLPMLALYSVPVAVIPDGLSFLPFVFAAAGFIWLLVSDSVDRVRRFGRRFTGEGRDVDVWEASPLSAAGRRLGVVGVVVAILLPLAVPGMTSGLLNSFGTGAGGGPGNGSGSGGSGSTVDLNGFLTGELSRNQVIEMVRVTTNDPSPFYLRLGIADQATQQGFVSRAPSGNPLSTLGDYVVPQMSGVTGGSYHADIEVLKLNMHLAPIYQQLVGVQGLNQNWRYEPSTDQVFSRQESVAARSYGVDYVRVSYTPQALRQASPIAGNDPVRQLARVPQVEYVSNLVSSLTKDESTEYDQVRAIYNYFTGPYSGFTYSLTTDEGDTGIAIVDFLTTKRGFCVQYAAAMTWLVRAAGYPARVAFGFTRGSGAINNTYTLTNLNLHAWTEVFFPDFGWVPFDSTPSTSIVGSVQTPWASEESPGEGGPTDPAANPSAGPSASGGRPLDGTEGQAGGGDLGGGAALVNPWWIVGAAVLALLVTLLLLPSLRRRSLSRSRRSRSGQVVVLGTEVAVPTVIVDPAGVADARRDAHAAWAELQDSMLDYGVEVDEAETPRATVSRMIALLAPPTVDGGVPAIPSEGADIVSVDSARPREARKPRHAAPLPDQMALLGRAEERARYARYPLHPSGLDAAVAAVREALAERATRRQRLMARLMPPSVLVSWRLAWVTQLAKGSARLSRIRERMAVANPRRILARSTR